MTATNGQHTATVETLTAQVRVLQVGNRQITMSVYNQLDHTNPSEIQTPIFGRVAPRGANASTLYVIGKHRDTGALVKSSIMDPHRIEKSWTVHLRNHGNYTNDPRHGPAEAADTLRARGYNYAGDPDWRNPGWSDDISWEAAYQMWADLCSLPLIVLAGLR